MMTSQRALGSRALDAHSDGVVPAPGGHGALGLWARGTEAVATRATVVFGLQLELRPAAVAVRDLGVWYPVPRPSRVGDQDLGVVDCGG